MNETPAAKNKRRLRGVVVGARADKTARVRITRQIKHPLYEKIIRRHGNVQAHDEDNSCRPGDAVVLEEISRTSKTKSWRVAERAPGKGRT
ncbi:MAG: 30S ribosomal protein S17 [Betaproteobacteria bacterium]|nr:30S ribosomal protein S17 [Betaproteobacteria bacterium]